MVSRGARVFRKRLIIAKRGSGKGGGEMVDGYPIEDFDNVIVVQS
jgi:hypothetical protein